MNAQTDISKLEVGFDVPALPGMDEAEIQTPALVLDLDALERNIKKMGDYAKAHGMRHRVHGKMHKSVDVAEASGRNWVLRLASAVRKYPRPRFLPGAASRTSWCRTR